VRVVACDRFDVIEQMVLDFYSHGAADPIFKQGPNASQVAFYVDDSYEDMVEGVPPGTIPSYVKAMVVNRSLAIRSSLRESSTAFGFSCDDTLKAKGLPRVPLPVSPVAVAAFSFIEEREYASGERFPSTQQGGGEFLTCVA